MIPPNVSTITRRAYNLPVTFHRLVLRFNHKHLRLKRIESKRIHVEEYLARIFQEMRDKVHGNVFVPVCNKLGADLSNDYASDGGWLERSDSD